MTGIEKTRGESVLPDSVRTCEVAERARRVVLASQGVLSERKLCRRRTRALALFAAAFVVLAVTPLGWWTVDTVIAGEHPAEFTSQIALWFLTLCMAIFSAVLVAGWLHSHK